MINHVVMVRVLLSFCWENYLILAPAFKEFRRKTPDPYREVVFVFQDVVVMLKYHKALETCLVIALRLQNFYDLKVNKLKIIFQKNSKIPLHSREYGETHIIFLTFFAEIFFIEDFFQNRIVVKL